ncbi:MAG: hypothetical protein NC419_02515 [Muribaculaceae bacterium]|nr:hypothetical protein [Muribaculaceae bacterium]
MRKWKQLLMIMSVAWIVSGCGSLGKSYPEGSTVSIQKNGEITQTIVEQFERNYYDVEELAAMTQDKVGRYSDGADNIVCKSVEEKDGTIVVQMAYKTGTDYTDFNNRELFSGTVAQAYAQGYSLKSIQSDNGTDMTDEDIAAISDNHILIIQTAAGEALNVNVYDKILYTSANVTISGKKDAAITAGEETVLSYIVFQ